MQDLQECRIALDLVSDSYSCQQANFLGYMKNTFLREMDFSRPFGIDSNVSRTYWTQHEMRHLGGFDSGILKVNKSVISPNGNMGNPLRVKLGFTVRGPVMCTTCGTSMGPSLPGLKCQCSKDNAQSEFNQYSVILAITREYYPLIA